MIYNRTPPPYLIFSSYSYFFIAFITTRCINLMWFTFNLPLLEFKLHDSKYFATFLDLEPTTGPGTLWAYQTHGQLNGLMKYLWKGVDELFKNHWYWALPSSPLFTKCSFNSFTWDSKLFSQHSFSFISK